MVPHVHWSALVPDHVFVTRGERGVKPGTLFVRADRRGRDGRTRRVFRPYDNVYKLLRAYRLHIGGWARVNIEALTEFRTLAHADLLAVYGVQIFTSGEFGRLQEQVAPLLAGRKSRVTRNREVRHAIDLYRITTTREGTRRTLGFASTVAHLDLRLDRLTATQEVVVSLGTLVADYIDGMIGEVRALRKEMDALLALTTDELYFYDTVTRLINAAARVESRFVVRPFTHVGGYVREECSDLAERLTALRLQPEHARAGTSEGIRNVIETVRNSLLLLEWQYDLELLITVITECIRDGSTMTEGELFDLHDRFEEIEEAFPEALGKRFTNNVLPKIHNLLWDAEEAASRPTRMKSLLVQASDAI